MHKALIRAGAARFPVSVAQLLSPRSVARETCANGMLVLELDACYQAFSEFFEREIILKHCVGQRDRH